MNSNEDLEDGNDDMFFSQELNDSITSLGSSQINNSCENLDCSNSDSMNTNINEEFIKEQLDNACEIDGHRSML